MVVDGVGWWYHAVAAVAVQEQQARARAARAAKQEQEQQAKQQDAHTVLAFAVCGVVSARHHNTTIITL